MAASGACDMVLEEPEQKEFGLEADWQATKNTVLERNRHMLNNPFLSDIMVTCDGSEQRFFAHRYVLCTSSSVFQKMFQGGLAKLTNYSVHIGDADVGSVQEFLSYLYTDECTLTAYNIATIMYLAKIYVVPSLAQKCVIDLAFILKPSNVLGVLEQAIYFEQTELVSECWHLVEESTSSVVSSDDFYNISQTTLMCLLKRKNLQIPEVELFRALLAWSGHQCSQMNFSPTPENRKYVIGNAIYEIRFLAMTQEEFAKFVSPSRLLSTNELVAIYETFNGIESPQLLWIKPSRDQVFTYIRCPNSPACHVVPKSFSDHTYFFISFSVCQDVIFHGVRLQHAGTGLVTLYVKNTAVDGFYNAGIRFTNVNAGYVLFPSPVTVRCGSEIMMLADIDGYSSGYYEWVERRVIEVDGISVAFSEAYLPYTYSCNELGTAISEGQFEEILLSLSS